MTNDSNENGATRILIVEDEAILAEDLGQSLTNLGYVVEGKVSTGEEAVELAEKLRPDLILMDIKLRGGMDGIEAANLIRMRLDIPVVYLTAYGEKDVLDRAKVTEPYGYMGKPFGFQELGNTLETAIYKHRADKRVRESEERFQLFMQHFPGLAYIKDAGGRVLFANSGFGRYLGLDPSSIIGKTNAELFPVDFAEKITADDSRVLESGEWQQIEEAYGGQFWSTHKFPIPRTGEKPLLGGFTVDISAHKQAENSLRESEEQYRALVETTDTGYVIVDHQGRVLDANSEYVRLTGRKNLDEVRGRSVIEWTAEYDRERNAREVQECFKEGFVRNLEIDYVDRKGDVTPIEINATVIRVKGHTQIVSLCRDITERKKAENQLKTSLRDKEVLLREIHHRVKNNLAVIQSLLRLQSRYVKNEALSQVVEDTQHRIRSMALCHELLYQSGSLSKIKISQYAENLLTHLMASFCMVGKRVEIKHDMEEAHLEIDMAVPLGFILTELISNCYRHAFPERGHGEISVSLRRVGAKNLELVVKDNGVGLPEDMDVEKPESLGYHLIGIFVRQLNGEMEIVRTRGTTVRIKFAPK